MKLDRPAKVNFKNKRQVEAFKGLLEQVHIALVSSGQILNDAQEPARKFKAKQDIEFCAFVCSILAYGKISQIKISIHLIIDKLGASPVNKLKSLNDLAIKNICNGWKHRFNTATDMEIMLRALRRIYSEYGSIESFVSAGLDDDAYEIVSKIFTNFKELRSVGIENAQSSFWFFLPDPQSGSACKRMNLFLRWMVGTGDTDFGLWSSVDKSRLIIPVDVHVLRQAQKFGLTQRKTADWKTALEITNKLKYLDPADPVRFDFALCHIGVTKAL